MTTVGSTISCRDALKRLREVKANDGWSVQIENNPNGDEELKLLRRSVPLTDNSFLDIHHSPQTNTIVGVLTKDGDKCQILVDGNSGRPVLQKKSVGYVSCANSYPGYKPLSTDERRASSSSGANQEGKGSFVNRSPADASINRTPAGSSSRSGRAPTSNRTGVPNPNNFNNNYNNAPVANPFAGLSEEERQKYIKYATIGVGSCVACKILADVLGEGLLFLLVLPGIYAYGLQTCPANSTFDAKKEVKRVLRGHHLPDDHPAKPRKGNFLEEWTAKISASVATEVSAVAGGYSTDIAPLLGGCAKHASVTLPTLGLTCEWIGFNDTWYHYRTYTPESQQQQQAARR